MQMGWWVVLAVAAAIWVRPESWAGAVAAVVAAAWYYGSERMDGTEQQQRPPSATFAWSGVGLIAVVACLAWLDVVALKTSPPDGVMWIALALFLTQTGNRSEEHTSELQSRFDLVCRLLLEKKKKYMKQ